MADIVDDFLTRLEQYIPNLPPEVSRQLESEIRHTWGGNEPYVGKRMRLVTRKMVASGLRQQLPIAEIFKLAGTSRATGYRVLKRK